MEINLTWLSRFCLTMLFAITYAAYRIGCYRDTARRAIPPLEGKSRLLRGNYRRRPYALQKCAVASNAKGYSMFALQHGGWCASSKRAYATFRRYGKSNKCRNGKGGPWANDVYVLRGESFMKWMESKLNVEGSIKRRLSLRYQNNKNNFTLEIIFSMSISESTFNTEQYSLNYFWMKISVDFGNNFCCIKDCFEKWWL